MKKILNIFIKDLLISFYKEGSALNILTFYILLILLFPIGISNNPEFLNLIGIGTIWITSFFTSVLSFERWLNNDYESGLLELYLFQSMPLELIILIKIITHWICYSLPLILITPISMLLYNLDLVGLTMVLKVLFYSTFCVTLLGSLVSIITISLKHKGIVLSIMIIPLYIPIFIFSIITLKSYFSGQEFENSLYCLKNIFYTMFICIPYLSSLILSKNL